VEDSSRMVEIRDLRAAETAFLGDMLYAALDWNPKRWLPPKWILLRLPQLRIFYRDWGRDGDTALVAEEDRRLLGLAWYRFFTEEVHGEGFVDERTPELAVAVVDGERGRGLGTSLMERIHARAREQGVKRISLSVDHGNPARRLYERLGYVEVAPDDERMVLDLT
jgi:GNAT superfamily N-acetyltransferase